MLDGSVSFITRFAIASTLILGRLQVNAACTGCSDKAPSSYRSVLYVWAGQDPAVKNAADLVAVIDFSERSPTYGSIIRVVRLVSNATDGIGQANNEPHHSSISSDGRFYITGGLLSFLPKQKEIFVWRIPQNPVNGPRFVCGIDAAGSGCPDEFQPIGDYSFLVSMMCDESADSPGDMVIIDPIACTAKSILQNRAALQNFNPHGYGRLNNGSILVGDYIVPRTLTYSQASEVMFQSTVRHFFPDGSLQRTFNFPNTTQAVLGSGIGFMELKAIPNDPLGRAYAGGSNTNLIYLITPGIREPLVVFNVAAMTGNKLRHSAGIMSIFPSGNHMLMTFQMRFVMLFDITNPESPKLLKTFDFCTDDFVSNSSIRVPGTSTTTTFRQYCAANDNMVGTHVIIHPPGETRFVVLNYFLQFGLAQFAGTRSVHAFKLNTDLKGFEYDRRFNPNFGGSSVLPTFHSLVAFPHHAQYLKL